MDYEQVKDDLAEHGKDMTAREVEVIRATALVDIAESLAQLLGPAAEIARDLEFIHDILNYPIRIKKE